MDNLTFNDRLNQLINSLDISVNKFETIIGWPKGSVQKISKGSLPGLENILKIFSKFPDISTDWLIRGRGQMKILEKEEFAFTDPAAQYNAVPLTITMDTSGRETILMVNSKAFAGYTTSSQEPEFLTELPSFGLGLPEFRNGTFRAFQASGSSMEGTLMNGDWVIGQYVDNWPSNITDGRVYIIVTKETILVKRLLNRLPDGKLIIISDNPAYGTDYVYAEDVRELWYAKAKFGFQFPNTRYDVLEEILNLKADVMLLQKEVGLALPARKGQS